MKTRRLAAILLTTIGAAATAQAAPCPDVRGEWNFTLQCAAIAPGGAPIFGTRLLYGTISAQTGCVFTGTLSVADGPGGEPWVGALHDDQNRGVASDYGGAKAVGELSDRRKGVYREMTMTYTFSGGPNPTACTGTGVRAD